LLAQVHSGALVGIDAHPVEVEIDVYNTTVQSNKEFSDRGNLLGSGAGLDRFEDDQSPYIKPARLPR